MASSSLQLAAEPSFEAIVEELVLLSQASYVWASRHRWPLVEKYPQFGRARELGKLIHDVWGFAAMGEAVEKVCQRLGSLHGEKTALLELGWEGIGMWQG